MRKLMCLMMGLCLAIGSMYADYDTITTDINQLPANSRELINTWFSNAQISHIKIEKDNSGVKGYEVLFTNGVEIEFNRSGEWTEIDGNNNTLPIGLVSNGIRDHISNNYSGRNIMKLEKDNGEIKVKLNDRTKLIYNNIGELIDID